jgi:dCTP deaminase
MSILTGLEIVRACNCGDIQIDPLVEAHVNPGSVDLTLGDQIATYEVPQRLHGVLDSRQPMDITTWRFTSHGGVVLRPGVGYLMHTAERVGSRKYVPVLDGKSSIGRLFIQVHATAGYGDTGFFGQWTLEVTVTHPVRVYAGMRIAQMRFHEVVGAITYYKGNYANDAAGPVASRAWRQFDREES